MSRSIVCDECGALIPADEVTYQDCQECEGDGCPACQMRGIVPEHLCAACQAEALSHLSLEEARDLELGEKLDEDEFDWESYEPEWDR